MTHAKRPSHLVVAALAIALVAPVAAHALEGTVWRTATGTGIVRIEPCDNGKTCGVLTRVTPPNGQPGVDGRNPNPALRARPLQGVRILTGFTRGPDGRYVGGQIYNPEDGRTYRSELKTRPDGKLAVKGCVGPVCQTQLWSPAP
jgi:uncharacterized protein (DUF2147 family)